MAIAEKKLVTADELIKMSAEGRRELVRGEVIELPLNGFQHGVIAAHLTAALGEHAIKHKLGDVVVTVGFHFERDPDTVRCADIAFLSLDSVPKGEARWQFVQHAPDLAVEIVAPTDGAEYLAGWIDDYLKAGARLIWIVYPSSRLVVEYCPPNRVRILRAGDRLDGGDVIPGFSCTVSDIFAA